jgi:uncharacterized protein
MTLDSDDERRLYLEGIRLFNAHQFFEAHEVWEDVWNAAYGPKHDFYQGLIQCAVALEHYRRSNPRGVVGLFRSYRRRFQAVPGVFMGLDVASFLAAMDTALAPVVLADPLPQRGQITLDPSTVPTIRLLYDPFETGEAAEYARPGKF